MSIQTQLQHIHISPLSRTSMYGSLLFEELFIIQETSHDGTNVRVWACL